MRLAHLPTPVESIELPLPSGEEVSSPSPASRAIRLKRDDMTGGVELTGNKTRKLEFLIADAVVRGCDIVVTTGGTQSNHCRATAAAARKAGIACHMTLRDDCNGDNGNFFIGGLLRASQEVIAKPDWVKAGGHSHFLAASAAAQVAAGRRPCAVPCGGSNEVGVWGYIECAREMLDNGQLDGVRRIVCASGSGGTVAGIAIGVALMRASGVLDHDIKVTSYGVCDSPDEFYNVIDEIVKNLGYINDSADAPVSLAARDIADLRDASGEGYGVTTAAERAYLRRVAAECGVVFDRTYTNKAVFAMARDIASGALDGEGILLIHTGGAPSIFDRHTDVRDA